MKNISKIINRYFPNIDGRIWVDLYSGVALVKFALGHQMDTTLFLGVLGIYSAHKAVLKMNDNENTETE